MSIEPWLVGIVKAPITCLVFPPIGLPRLASEDNLGRKRRLFKKNLCSPHIVENHIRVDINKETLKKILTILQVSSEQLESPHLIQRLPPDVKLDCKDGRHRAKAAESLSGDKFEWTIRLYCADKIGNIPQLSQFNHLFRQVSESFSFEDPYKDGEIFRKIKGPLIMDVSEKEDWTTRLSQYKEINLRGLERHEKLTAAFESLLQWPGLWVGLKLGNIHKNIALHCNELLINYTTYISQTWGKITNYNTNLAQLVDPKSVRSLQYLVPSSQDGTEICKMFADMTLFPEVTDVSARHVMLSNLLSIKGFIPSIETLHKDARYLALA
ncbi:hypothetical protein F5883DRAFT_422681, partial [Diaporthe sp. PMI_573]